MSRFDRINKLQASIFFSTARLGSSAQLQERLVDLLQPVKAYPLPLQVEADAPPEFPRALLFSPDSLYQIHVSLLRADASLLPHGQIGIDSPDVERFWTWAANCWSRFASDFQCEVTRLAAVAEVLGSHNVHGESAPDFVRRALFSDRLPESLVGGLSNAEFHAHRTLNFNVGGRIVAGNVWTRIRAVHVAPNSDPVLHLEIDTNTAESNPPESFTNAEIQAFLLSPMARVRYEVETINAIE